MNTAVVSRLLSISRLINASSLQRLACSRPFSSHHCYFEVDKVVFPRSSFGLLKSSPRQFALRSEINDHRTPARSFSTTPTPTTAGEQKITRILQETFPSADSIDVRDISGGCGEMYEIRVESLDFSGKRTLQQHRLVTQAIKHEVENMHGLRIFTSVPGSS